MKTRAIIPCCGYGTRMNMRPDQSKELLLDSNGKVLIDYHLKLCIDNDMAPLVITRKEKKDLISYCESRGIETLIIKPKGEWPDTIMQSKKYWAHNNILLLPDTRFEPINIIDKIKVDLILGANASIGLHYITDSNAKWCTVKDYVITEKPAHDDLDMFAMGIIGFKASYGVKLFRSLSKRGVPLKLANTSFQYLDWFKDVTRTGKIEI